MDESDLVSSFSRAQAIEDGVLVDVTTTAKEAGFKIPVALTRAVWVDCVEWSESTKAKKFTLQDENGRLWDVLYMASMAARGTPTEAEIRFDMYRVPPTGTGRMPRRVTLKMHVGPGDTAAPVITIMQPSES